MPKYEYIYTVGPHADEVPLAKCPQCGHDLTQDNGIHIEFVTNGGRHFEEWSKLDAKGKLLDPTDDVAKGNHSATTCGNCREILINLDNIDENLQVE